MEKKRGFNITIVTTAKTDYEGYFFLNELGFPFSEELKETTLKN
jgi:ribosomal protein L5